jgi:DNA-binding response OmpR family regulator
MRDPIMSTSELPTIRVAKRTFAPTADAPTRAEESNLRDLRPAAPAYVTVSDARAPLRVAILDRDSGFIVVLLKHLQRVDWAHTILAATTPATALANIEADVLIVDLAVVGERPWAWLTTVCRLRPELSIVVCSRPSSVSQRVLSLRLGADDWLTKPCHPEELIARIEAITGPQRRQKTRNLQPSTIGEIEIRPDQYQAFVAHRSLALTVREYQLIELLARGEGEVQERERIYEALWGRQMMHNDRSVDVCVHKLRRKLELGSPGWHYIHTHYGVGYRLAAEPVAGSCVLELRAGTDVTDTSLAA